MLEKYLSFDEKIAPVCLPSKTYPNAGFLNRFTITIQGWGQDDNGEFGEDLTRIDLTIRRNSLCNKKYETISAARKSYWFPQLLTPQMFCANSNLGDKIGTCYGDSGGPSMIQDDNGVSYILMGVVSGNPGECGNTQEYPDFFTFIGHENILPWIISNVQKTRKFGDQQYPSVVYLSSSSSDYTFDGDILGIYKMHPSRENNNRPVWQHIKNKHWFYYDNENYWTFSTSVNQKHPSASKSSTIRSEDRGLVYLPSDGFRFWDGSNWILDSSISILSGKSTYPEMVNLINSNQSLENNNFEGNYKRISNKLFKNRPIWKNKYEKYLYFSGLQWNVGGSVGSEDNDSIAVYGWDYSDEELIWPNTDKLFMIHYPENVTLSSTGAARELWPNYMGIHRRVPNLTRNGRPVWRSIKNSKDEIETVLIYNDNHYWTFLPEPAFDRKKEHPLKELFSTSFKEKIISAEKGLFSILNQKWQYRDDKGLIKDDQSLAVKEGEPYFPDLLTFVGKKEDKKQSTEIGLYKKQSFLRNGRPVWKRITGFSTSYLYYTGRYWTFGPHYDSDYGLTSSLLQGLLTVPKNGWEYYDYHGSKKWINDETLTVFEGWPSYPSSINIIDLSNQGKFKTMDGKYDIVQGREENNKPIWKHENLDEYVFNIQEDQILPNITKYKDKSDHQWFIGDKIGKLDNSFEIYGWDYSDDKYVWPNTSTLYITNYPKTFSLQSEGELASRLPGVLGRYELYPGLINSRPRWRNSIDIGLFLLYGESYGLSRWTFVGFAIKDNSTLYSKSNELILSKNEWEILTEKGEYIHDDTITIVEGEPTYPGAVAVSSNGTAGEKFDYLMGLYKKVPKLEAGGKPVWRHVLVDWFLFFDDLKPWSSDNQQWKIGPNYNFTLGLIRSEAKGELNFGKTDWSFKNGTEWVTDELLYVSKNWPRYPGTISVNGSKSRENSSFTGSYTKTTQTFNNRPYFKKDNHYIFSDGKEWFVGDRLGTKDSASSTIYGWEYSDEEAIWPNISTLNIFEYPEALNVSSSGGALKLFPNLMGIYKIVSGLIFSGRPVWEHSTSLVYLYYMQGWQISQAPGDWVTSYIGTGPFEWENILAIPERGWQYVNASTAFNDTTLIVQALH